MSKKKATRRAVDQLPPDPSTAVVPENHPGDVRTYPPGSKIVGGTLELPTSGKSDSQKASECFEAAVAKVEGQSFQSNGVELGREQPQVIHDLAADIAENREQIVNVGARMTVDLAIPKDPAERARARTETLASPPLSLASPAERQLPPRLYLRDLIEAEAVRHEKAFDDLLSGACQTSSPLTTDAIRQLRLTAIGLADDPATSLDELELAYNRLVAVDFTYPNGGGR